MVGMKLSALPLAALLIAMPVSAEESAIQPTPLSLEQRMLVRCSVAFAMTAYAQDQGDERAQQYPPLGERGQEFFVRSSAQVMDDAGLDFEQMASEHEREALNLRDSGQIDEIMPVCLQLLEQSGL
jgi:hypothetical protein